MERPQYTPESDAGRIVSEAFLSQAELYVQAMKVLVRARELAIRARQAQGDTVETRLILHQERRAREDAGRARENLRREVSAFVQKLRAAGESVTGVVSRAGQMLKVLRESGAAPDERGVLEAEVIRWVLDEYYAT